MRYLEDAAIVKTQFEDADFWLIRKGSYDMVGCPTKTYSPEHIGVKVTRTDVLVPDYLYYVFLHFYKKGCFKPLAHGSLKLQHIRVSEVKRIKFLD